MVDGTPYPVVIAAIKEWIGGHKTAPSASVVIDGQPGIKKAGFMDMLQMAFSEAISFATTVGAEFALGGDVNGLLDKLPPGFSGPLRSLGDSVSTLSEGAFSSGVLKDFKEAFINPIGDTITSFKDSLTASSADLQTMYAAAEASDPTVANALQSAATKLGGTFNETMTSFKGWTDSLTLGTGDGGFKLTDAFDAVNSSSTKAFELFGVTQAPTLTSLCGSLVKDNLVKDYSVKAQAEIVARTNLKDKLPILDPNQQGNPPPLSDEAQAAFELWQTAFNELEDAHDAILVQVESDQEAVAALQKQDAVMGFVGTVTANYNSITDPDQKALYESTLQPHILTTVQSVGPLIQNATNQPTITV